MPKLRKQVTDLKFDVNLPSVSDSYVGASHGLADILEHFNMNTTDVARGEIMDFVTEKVYKAKSPLNSMELMQIANEAKGVGYMDGFVTWMTTALKKAKEEKRDAKYISTIK